MYFYICLHCFKCNIRCLNGPVRDTITKKSPVELKISLTVKDDFFFLQSANAVRQVCYDFILSVKLQDSIG